MVTSIIASADWRRSNLTVTFPGYAPEMDPQATLAMQLSVIIFLAGCGPYLCDLKPQRSLPQQLRNDERFNCCGLPSNDHSNA